MPWCPPLRRLGVAPVLRLPFLVCLMAVAASAFAAPIGSVSGTVVDQTGGSLAGVRVALLAAPNVEVCWTTTDAAGRYRLERLEPAGYVLVLSKPGFSEYRRSVVVDAAGVVSIDVTLGIEPVDEFVTVTALRGSPQEIARAPQFVTVTPSSEIESRDSAIFPRALVGEVGVEVQQTSTGQGSPFVRGLTGQQVVALIDGVRFNNATFRPGANQYTALVDPSFADRVEIVRGPNGAEYGSDSLGGTINVVTAPVVVGRRGIGVDGGLSLTFASADLSGASTARVAASGPTWGFFVDGSGRRAQDLRTGRAIDSHSVATRLLGLPSSVLGDRLHDTAFTQYGVQAKFAVHPTTKDFLTVQYIRGAQLGASRYDQLDGGIGNLLNKFDPQALDFASVRYDRVGPALFDTASASFSYNGQVDDRTYQNVNNNRLGLLSPVSAEHNRTSVVGWQAHGTKLLRAHTIGVGGEWYDELVTSTRRDFAYSAQTEGFTTATEARGRFPNGARYRTMAVYAQDAFPLFSPRLTATVAVRYSRFRYGQNTADNASWATASTLPTYEVSFGDATFNTGVAFALTPQVVLTASVSRGFRAPNVNDFGSVGVSGIGFEVTPDEGMRLGASVAPLVAGTPPADQVWPVHALRPERMLNYEAGAKFSWRGLSGTAAAFDSEIEDLIERRVAILAAGAVGGTIGGQTIIRQDASGAVYTALSSSPVFVRTNAGHVRLRGAEAAVTVRLSPTLRVDANVSSVRGVDVTTGLPPGLENGIPPTHGFAGLRWEPGGARWWVEGYTLFAAAQTRLSGNDLGQARIGGIRTRSEIANFFNNGAVARGLVSGGILLPTGETLPEVLARVLGSDLSAQVPFMTENPGFVTLNLRGGIRFSRRAALTLIAENLLDSNYRIMGSGVDGPGFNLVVRQVFTF